MDKAFVKKALEGSMAEVEMGKLALQKSSDDQVKQFAQRMVDDHSKMVDELKPVAEQLGVKVPDGPSKGQKKKMDKMQALSGDAFDQAYIKDMVKDHKSDDSEFKQEAQSTQNPQLKQMVMQSDQIIESHLQQIQQIAQTNEGNPEGKDVIAGVFGKNRSGALSAPLSFCAGATIGSTHANVRKRRGYALQALVFARRSIARWRMAKDEDQPNGWYCADWGAGLWCRICTDAWGRGTGHPANGPESGA